MQRLSLADIYICVPLYQYGPDVVSTVNRLHGTWVLYYDIGLEYVLKGPIKTTFIAIWAPENSHDGVVEFQAQVLQWTLLHCVFVQKKK